MQQLKQQRLTPAEKFVLDAIKGVEPSNPDWCGDVAWYKDGKWLFSQSFNYAHLLINHNYFCSILLKKYGLNKSEITQLLTKLLHKYTNNGNLEIFFSI